MSKSCLRLLIADRSAGRAVSATPGPRRLTISLQLMAKEKLAMGSRLSIRTPSSESTCNQCYATKFTCHEGLENKRCSRVEN
jgi:hypothetical protein